LRLTILFALAMLVSAQQEPNVRNLWFMHVKPERLDDYRAAVKDYVATAKQAGSERYFSNWSSVSGPATFVVSQYFSKWADVYTGPEEKTKSSAGSFANIVHRILECVSSREDVWDQLVPGTLVPLSGEMPKFVRVATIDVKPDKVDEFMALTKSDVVPAIKKSGASAYGMYRTVLGGPTVRFSSYVSVNALADLDGPLGAAKGMSEAEYKEFSKKTGAMGTIVQFNAYRFESEMSYLPPPK
jgi:hypothetical protein